MGERRNSLAKQLQSLVKNQADFPKNFKQRLILESNKVTNPSKFIASLFTKDTMCDRSNDPKEATFGLKEMIVQLSIMIACSKGSEAIGDLMEALEESGNSEVISALRTWVKRDFAVEGNNGDMSKAHGAVQAPTPEMSTKQMKNGHEMSSIDAKLINKIVSMLQEETELMEKLEGHWIAMASQVVNIPDFCSSLVQETVLHESDKEFGSEDCIIKAIKAACSNRAIGSLVVAFKRSGNEHLIEETYKWLETSQARKKYYPVLAKSLPQEPAKPVGPKFFEQAAPSNELGKVATFKCEPSTKGPISLDFNKKRIIAHLHDSTVQLWNWIDNEEKSIKFGEKVKLKPSEAITSFQYDDEVLVLGTSDGTVYLFDARTLEEKWSVRLGEPISFLHFVESWIIILTVTSSMSYVHKREWCVELSRSKMQLLNINSLSLNQSMDDVEVINLANFMSTKCNIVAGFKDGRIATWKDSVLRVKPFRSHHPDKWLVGHKAAVVSLCAINGHVISLDQSGKLLMWSGYDLENELVNRAFPRILAENFHNVTCLAGCERWFASYSSKDGIISIWTLPDLWLRTG